MALLTIQQETKDSAQPRLPGNSLEKTRFSGESARLAHGTEIAGALAKIGVDLRSALLAAKWQITRAKTKGGSP
ncbi:MAG TPA: hypothetical protein VNN77_13485 [candidate division Zixibacteria bacterium]|nr:hypothetical protein [candidate division Zixibacteria bacterium]